MAQHASLNVFRNEIIKIVAYHKNDRIGSRIADLRQLNALLSGNKKKAKRKTLNK
jgi:hypothetical protein